MILKLYVRKRAAFFHKKYWTNIKICDIIYVRLIIQR